MRRIFALWIDPLLQGQRVGYYSGHIPWFKTGDLGSRFAREPEEFITQEGLENSSAKIFPKGAVAIAMYGATIGKTSTLAIDAATNQACAVAIVGTGVDKNFFYHQLNNEKERFIAKGKGGAQPNISQAIIKSHLVNLPPANEQTRIANKLDELLAQVDTIKARVDAIPAIVKRFRQSVLEAAVSGRLTEEWRTAHSVSKAQWERHPLEKLIVEMRNGLSPKPNEDGRGTPILRISSVRAGQVDQSDIRHLECDLAVIDKYKLFIGDILFTRYNGSLEFVGVCGLIQSMKHETLLYPDKLIRIMLAPQ